MILLKVYHILIISISIHSLKAYKALLPDNAIFNKNEEVLFNCIARMVRKHFNYKPTIVTSANYEENNTHSEFYNRLTKHLVENFIPRILVKEMTKEKNIYMQDGYTVFIKYFDHCELLPALQMGNIDERAKYLVVIFDLTKENCVERFEAVGKNLSRYDVTFLLKIQDEDDYKIFSFIPQMNSSSCAVQYDLPPTFLSTCSSKEDFVSFPLKKPQDLMKCPFKVGMASLFPFTKITNKTSLKTLDPLYENKGSDFEVLKIMAKYFNFSVQYYYIFRMEENPYVISEFLGFLLNGTLDACAGGLYNIYGDAVDYSGVYGRQAVIWMYPVSRTARSWQNFVSKVNGMYVFMIFYVCYSIIWYLFSKYDNQALSLGNMLLYSWGALIGTSSLLDAISLKQKILNVVYLVLCMHLSAYISIQMFSFLTIVGPPTVYKTNAELILSGLKPYLIAITKYFVSDPAYEAFANTSEDCNTFAHCEELSLQYNGVTVVIDSLFTLLQVETAVNDEARTLRVSENLLTVYHEMLLRKDVTINKSFRKVLLRLTEAGIMDRLYYESVGILTWAKAASATKNIMSYSYSCELGCSITLEQTAGAFYLWFVGCCLSICAFVVELMLKRERNVAATDGP